jgi:hypothetical protein
MAIDPRISDDELQISMLLKAGSKPTNHDGDWDHDEETL